MPSHHRFIPALPTLDPSLFFAKRQAAAFPLDHLIDSRGAQLFYLARAGIHHAFSHLLTEGSRRVLMPAYHHGVEVEAVRASGATIEFYRVDRQMQIDLGDLEARLARRRAAVVYLTYFVGLPQPVDEVRALCRAHGARLFEDCALALLSRFPDGRAMGTLGDAAVYCLYKTLPVPHGGLLLGDFPPAARRSPPTWSTLHHLVGAVLAHLERNGGRAGQLSRRAVRALGQRTVDPYLDVLKTGTTHLDPSELDVGVSALTAQLLPRFAFDQVVARRRANFWRLATALEGVLPIIGHPLAEGACPLFLPVRVADKQSLLRRLLQAGVEAVDFWSSGDPACDPSVHRFELDLRRQVLELPCHQALDDEDLAHIARTVKEAVHAVAA